MFTIEKLEDMLSEINWSGTAGFNIPTQKKLVEELLELKTE